MDNYTEDFSSEESLRVIQTMIDKAKNSVADKSFYFLIWGWLGFTGALLQFLFRVVILPEAGPTIYYIMWFGILFLGLVISIFQGVKQKVKRRVKTYIDESLGDLWTCIGICELVIIFIFLRRGDWDNSYAFFMLLYSIGCFISGRILHFTPMVWGAIASWLLILLSTFTSGWHDYNVLLLAMVILVGYIIPGHLLRTEYIRIFKTTA